MTTKEETVKILGELAAECEQARNQSRVQESDENEDGWCGMVWDNIMCWNKTRPGTVARLPCPAYITHFDTSEYAERICTENGTWWVNPLHRSTWTNFSRCVIPSPDISSHVEQADNLILLYTIGYSVSLASLVVAVIIMLYWRRLHCKSNTLHINLFIAFILRASMSFMKDRLFVGGLGLPQDVMQGQDGLVFIYEGSHWECRTLFVLLMFAISASQTWMLMEGLYLYLLVHKTLTTERLGVRPYIILGWALPWTFLIPWIVVKSIFENTYCWNMQENPAYFWIMKGPWTAIVVINFIFFIDIIRVMITRVRNNQRHVGRSQYRKFGKFVLVLIPLFGIMYIVLNVAFPSGVHGQEYNVVYLYIEMGYNSFQGFILALLFCFLNEDVHAELRRSWQRQQSRRNNSNIFKSSWLQSTGTSYHGSLSLSKTSSSKRRDNGSRHQKQNLKLSLSAGPNLAPTTSAVLQSPGDVHSNTLTRQNRSSFKNSSTSSCGSGRHYSSINSKNSLIKSPVSTSLVSKGFLGRSAYNGYEVEMNTSDHATHPLRTSFE